MNSHLEKKNKKEIIKDKIKAVAPIAIGIGAAAYGIRHAKKAKIYNKLSKKHTYLNNCINVCVPSNAEFLQSHNNQIHKATRIINKLNKNMTPINIGRSAKVTKRLNDLKASHWGYDNPKALKFYSTRDGREALRRIAYRGANRINNLANKQLLHSKKAALGGTVAGAATATALKKNND